MGTPRTGAGITAIDTTDAARAGTDDIIDPGIIGRRLTDVDITGTARAAMGLTCAATGHAAITGPGTTTRPTCTFRMSTCLASTCTSCCLCTDGRANVSLL